MGEKKKKKPQQPKRSSGTCLYGTITQRRHNIPLQPFRQQQPKGVPQQCRNA